MSMPDRYSSILPSTTDLGLLSTNILESHLRLRHHINLDPSIPHHERDEVHDIIHALGLIDPVPSIRIPRVEGLAHVPKAAKDCTHRYGLLLQIDATSQLDEPVSRLPAVLNIHHAVVLRMA